MMTVPTKLQNSINLALAEKKRAEYMKAHPYKHPQYYRRHKKDLKSKLVLNITSRINSSLRKNIKANSWENILGYNLKDLIKRLKSTMPKGYDWRSLSKFHIDHIIPVRAFVFDSPGDEGFKLCWDLCNLQLLPVRENIIKKDKINPILLGLIITYNQNKKGE